MATARAMAIKGHQVILMEKENKLGGQLNVACIPPHKQEISKWISYLNNELKRLYIDVKYGAKATKELIDSFNPDIVVMML